MVVPGAVAINAAPNNGWNDADARLCGAANELRQIKPKFAEQVRTLSTEAASRNNACVAIVCQAIEQGATSAPDVSSVAEPATSSLVEWVGGPNKALGLPVLTGANAESAKRLVLQNVSHIAARARRDNRSRDAEKRKRAAATLRERRRWKAFEEIQ
jgi:hypothetical protein